METSPLYFRNFTSSKEFTKRYSFKIDTFCWNCKYNLWLFPIFPWNILTYIFESVFSTFANPTHRVKGATRWLDFIWMDCSSEGMVFGAVNVCYFSFMDTDNRIICCGKRETQ